MTKYNTAKYNTELYNADVTFHLVRLDDTTTLTDATISKTIGKGLSDSTSLADTRTQDTVKPLADSVNLVDTVTKSITKKGLSDSIRLNDWLTVKKNPQNSEFHD